MGTSCPALSCMTQSDILLELSIRYGKFGDFDPLENILKG